MKRKIIQVAGVKLDCCCITSPITTAFQRKHPEGDLSAISPNPVAIIAISLC